MKRTFDPVTRTWPYCPLRPPRRWRARRIAPEALLYHIRRSTVGGREGPVCANERARRGILWAVPQDRKSDGTFPVVSALDAALR